MFNKKRIQELEDRIKELEDSILREQISNNIKALQEQYPEITIDYIFPNNPDDCVSFLDLYEYGVIFINNISFRAGNSLKEMIDYTNEELRINISYFLHHLKKLKIVKTKEIKNTKKK